ncbi:MAG: hypothetical protein SF187_19240 [Deltaproteobacteria bacterium]|nr:hypothetical protein [Deltaproteobacteria bacterium]
MGLLANPLQRTLEILHLGSDGRWIVHGVHHDDAKIRAEPFDAIEFDLSVLWDNVQASSED